MKAARGFHETAALLEKIHKQDLISVPKGTTLDVDIISQIMGRITSATVLEALALELILKARLNLAGLAVKRTHNHATLFAKLPSSEREQARQLYQASRHPAMRATLEEALAYSGQVFEQWRYLHEHPQVEASMGEMQRAFEALAHGITP